MASRSVKTATANPNDSGAAKAKLDALCGAQQLDGQNVGQVLIHRGKPPRGMCRHRGQRVDLGAHRHVSGQGLVAVRGERPDQTVRLDRDMLGWTSSLIQTPVYVDTIFASGEVGSSFWAAVVENPVLDGLTFEDRNRLIDHLDRVFQWQMDFSRQIRTGDTYRFAFEREVRPDGSMRAGRLLAAEFVNSGTPYHAVYFDPNGDGRGSYFDLEGESVRRAFFRHAFG